MKGFIIFENKQGQLLYSKNYNQYPFTNVSLQDQPIDSLVAEKKTSLLKVEEKSSMFGGYRKRSNKNTVMDV